MKLETVFLTVGAAFLAASARPADHRPNPARDSQPPGVAVPAPPRSVADSRWMLGELEAIRRQDRLTAGRSVGDLWIGVDRLKRDGHPVRPIGWYLSDLEGSLRVDTADSATRRHLLNNLHYEIESLNRRSR